MSTLSTTYDNVDIGVFKVNLAIYLNAPLPAPKWVKWRIRRGRRKSKKG
jgi:hypothetical protein